jgi:hypothetical protein
MDLRCLILLSCQRALLGIVFSKIRAITIDYDNSLFHWRVYFDGEPDENEKETLSVACTEILADLPCDVIESPTFTFKEEYINIPYPQELTILKEYVYLRYEEPLINS